MLLQPIPSKFRHLPPSLVSPPIAIPPHQEQQETQLFPAQPRSESTLSLPQLRRGSCNPSAILRGIPNSQSSLLELKRQPLRVCFYFHKSQMSTLKAPKCPLTDLKLTLFAFKQTRLGLSLEYAVTGKASEGSQLSAPVLLAMVCW